MYILNRNPEIYPPNFRDSSTFFFVCFFYSVFHYRYLTSPLIFTPPPYSYPRLLRLVWIIVSKLKPGAFAKDINFL